MTETSTQESKGIFDKILRVFISNLLIICFAVGLITGYYVHEVANGVQCLVVMQNSLGDELRVFIPLKEFPEWMMNHTVNKTDILGNALNISSS
jgi:hypothetical protein